MVYDPELLNVLVIGLPVAELPSPKNQVYVEPAGALTALQVNVKTSLLGAQGAELVYAIVIAPILPELVPPPPVLPPGTVGFGGVMGVIGVTGVIGIIGTIGVPVPGV